MTSEPTSAYVWIWLPGAIDPVVCGRLDRVDDRIAFVYARSYLASSHAVSIYDPELPLKTGYQYPASAQTLGVPLCIDDAMPDSWGRRLVNHRLGELMVEFGDLTDEQSAQTEIFAMRLEQYPAEDGMPEHCTPAWKARGENWA